MCNVEPSNDAIINANWQLLGMGIISALVYEFIIIVSMLTISLAVLLLYQTQRVVAKYSKMRYKKLWNKFSFV